VVTCLSIWEMESSGQFVGPSIKAFILGLCYSIKRLRNALGLTQAILRGLYEEMHPEARIDFVLGYLFALIVHRDLVTSAFGTQGAALHHNPAGAGATIVADNPTTILAEPETVS